MTRSMARLAGTRGGRGGDTEGPSSLQIGDMLDPETDMLGDVAGELVINWGWTELGAKEFW